MFNIENNTKFAQDEKTISLLIPIKYTKKSDFSKTSTFKAMNN